MTEIVAGSRQTVTTRTTKPPATETTDDPPVNPVAVNAALNQAMRAFDAGDQRPAFLATQRGLLAFLLNTVEVISDPAWIRQQDSRKLAILLGVATQRATDLAQLIAGEAPEYPPLGLEDQDEGPETE